MKKIVLLVLGFSLLPAICSAGCYGIAGVQFNRYVWDADQGKPVSDGQALASAGMLCEVIAGKIYSLDAGASLGTVINSSMFADNRSTAAINLGIDYDDLVTLGLAPHFILGESWTDPDSFGVGVFASFRVNSWLQFFGDIFSDGMQESITESLGEN